MAHSIFILHILQHISQHINHTSEIWNVLKSTVYFLKNKKSITLINNFRTVSWNVLAVSYANKLSQPSKCVATGYHLHWMMGFQGSCLDRALPVICFIPVSIFLWVFSWIALTVMALHHVYLWLQYNLYFMHFRAFKAMKDSITEVYIGAVNLQILGDFHALLGASGCLVWRMIVPC